MPFPSLEEFTSSQLPKTEPTIKSDDVAQTSSATPSSAQVQTQSTAQEPQTPRVSLAEFGRKVKEVMKRNGTFPKELETEFGVDNLKGAMSEEELIKQRDILDEKIGLGFLKQFPKASLVVDIKSSSAFDRIKTEYGSQMLIQSRFQNNLARALQPTEGKVQRGLSAEQRVAAQIPINVPRLYKALKEGRAVEDFLAQHDEYVGIDSAGRQAFTESGIDPLGGWDKEKLNAILSDLATRAYRAGQKTFPQDVKSSYLMLAQAYKEGGVPLATEMSNQIGEEHRAITSTLHDITDAEKSEVEAAKRKAAFQTGLYEAATGFDQTVKNVVGGLAKTSPFGVATQVAMENPNQAIIPGVGQARQALNEAAPEVEALKKTESVGQALIHAAPGVAAGLGEMTTMAGAGSMVGAATKIGPVLGGMLGLQADTAIQNLDKPLTEQAKHQLMTAALNGSMTIAPIAQAVLAKYGIAVSDAATLGATAGVSAAGNVSARAVLDPNATKAQLTADALIGGMLPLGFAAIHAGQQRLGQSKPRLMDQVTEQPRQIAGLLPEPKFNIRSEQANKIGQQVVPDQLPLFDTVGREVNVGTANKPNYQPGTLERATIENKIQSDKDLGIDYDGPIDHDILTTPFRYGEAYKLVEDADKYYKIQDVNNPKSIFRIAKESAAGLAAEIRDPQTINEFWPLGTKEFKVDQSISKFKDREMIFPLPGPSKGLEVVDIFGDPKVSYERVGEQEARFHLNNLKTFASSKEFKQLPKEKQAVVRDEVARLGRELLMEPEVIGMTPEELLVSQRKLSGVPVTGEGGVKATGVRVFTEEGWKGGDKDWTDITLQQIDEKKTRLLESNDRMEELGKLRSKTIGPEMEAKSDFDRYFGDWLGIKPGLDEAFKRAQARADAGKAIVYEPQRPRPRMAVKITPTSPELPTLYTNWAALKLFQAAYKSVYPDSKWAAGSSNPVAIETRTLPKLIGELLNESTRHPANSTERTELEGLAGVLGNLWANKNSKSFSLLPVLDGQAMKRIVLTRRHEIVHQEQFNMAYKVGESGHGIYKLTDPGFLATHPLSDKILSEGGALLDHYAPEAWTAEAVAYAASGEGFRIGLTPGESAQLVSDYRTHLQAKYGEVGGKIFKRAHPEVARLISNESIKEARKGPCGF